MFEIKDSFIGSKNKEYSMFYDVGTAIQKR
jgi:hypothetical protein